MVLPAEQPAKRRERDVEADIMLTVGALPYVRLQIARTVHARYRDRHGKTWHVQAGTIGQPDINGFMRCGLRVEIEAKHPRGGAKREAQELYAAICREWNVLYVKATDAQQVLDAVRAHAASCAVCLASVERSNR